jgi:hypothetical protein
MTEAFLAVLRSLHILAGSVALATFWIPWLVKKGARVHRRVGWVYTLAMAVVSASALISCIWRSLDASPDNDRNAHYWFWAWVLPGLLGGVAVNFASRHWQRALRVAPPESHSAASHPD